MNSSPFLNESTIDGNSKTGLFARSNHAISPEKTAHPPAYRPDYPRTPNQTHSHVALTSVARQSIFPPRRKSRRLLYHG